MGVLQIVPFSGTIYGLLIFAVVAVIYLLRSILRSSAAAIRVQAAPYVPSTAQPAGPAFSAGAAEGAQERLNELKRLRASDLITEAEYQAKRAEILKDI